jgi:ubiquinol-cytochrome c reductase cytochrome c subunit
MRLLKILTITASLSLALQAQTPAPQPAAPAAARGNAETGKKLFDSVGCYQCHGYVGQGGAGARLAPRPLAYTAFSNYVRKPTGQMPPYTVKVVTDAQLADIYAYLQSITEPPAVDSIPILKNE